MLKLFKIRAIKQNDKFNYFLWCWMELTSLNHVIQTGEQILKRFTPILSPEQGPGQGCPTFLPGRIDFMKSPLENMKGRFSLRNLPMEGRKDILPLKSPLENSKGESLFKISLRKRENIFSGEFEISLENSKLK